MRTTGRFRSNIGPVKALRFIYAIAIVYVSQADVGIRDVYARDLSNFPGCVWENGDDVYGDILPSHLKYESISGKETDKPDLHSEFVDRVLETTNIGDKHNEFLYITFAIYYEFDKGVYEQFASAILCRREFVSSENECRNRTYFTFTEIGQAEWAEILLSDISKVEPIIRRCRFPGDHHELPDSSSAPLGRVMTKIQTQISRSVRNPADGRFYNRSRNVSDTDGDGTLEVSGETIHSADDARQLPSPSDVNQTP